MKDQKEGGKTKTKERRNTPKSGMKETNPRIHLEILLSGSKTTGVCPFALLATHASCLHLFPCFYYKLSLQYTLVDGFYPLHRAAMEGYLSIANLLLQAGATVDAVNNGGWTALHSAAYAGKIQVVEALLNAGADKALKSSAGDTALDKAQKKNHPAIVKLLRD